MRAGERTYQLLAYAAAQSIRTYDSAFRATIGSYERETDPAVLNVQPRTIESVRLSSAMTFTEFLRRYPMPIEANEAALINQVGNPAARIPAGTWLKQVEE